MCVRVLFPLVVALLLPGVALAQKSGGKSYSGGGVKSSGGGKSYSGGGSSGSKGYSGGSSKPSGSSSSGGGVGSVIRGGSSYKPGGGSYDSGAGSAMKRKESQDTYTSKNPKPTPNVPGPPPNRPSGPSRYDPPPVIIMPGSRGSNYGGTWFPRGRSRATTPPPPPRDTVQVGPAPRSNYTTAGGETRPIDPNDRRVEQLRRELDVARYENRALRRSQELANVTRPPGAVVVYRDPYADTFWWWLLAQNLETRSAWAYNHRSVMDDLRYRELLARDQQLAARVKELEAQNAPRDPTAAPTGIDPDLMYDDRYVEAVVNPHTTSAPVRVSGGGFGRGLFLFLLIAGFFAFVFWIVFVKRWSGSAAPPTRTFRGRRPSR